MKILIYKNRFNLLIITFLILSYQISYCQEHRPLIGVIPFTAVNVSKSDAKIIAGLFETALVNTGVFTVIEQDHINKIMEEQTKILSGSYDEQSAIEIGKLLTAEQIVLGTLLNIGNKYILNAKIIDVSKGTNLRADKVEAKSFAQMIEVVDILAYRLANVSLSYIYLFSLHLEPGVGIPIGKSDEYLGFAGTIDLSCEYRLPALTNLYLIGGLGYNFNPIRNFDFSNIKLSFSIFSAKAGLGLNFSITSWFGLKVYASGGYYYGFLNDTSRFVGAGNPFLSAGGGFYLPLAPRFSLFLGASYKNFLGFFDSIDASLGAVFHFARRKKIVT